MLVFFLQNQKVQYNWILLFVNLECPFFHFLLQLFVYSIAANEPTHYESRYQHKQNLQIIIVANLGALIDKYTSTKLVASTKQCLMKSLLLYQKIPNNMTSGSTNKIKTYRSQISAGPTSIKITVFQCSTRAG